MVIGKFSKKKKKIQQKKRKGKGICKGNCRNTCKEIPVFQKERNSFLCKVNLKITKQISKKIAK